MDWINTSETSLEYHMAFPNRCHSFYFECKIWLCDSFWFCFLFPNWKSSFFILYLFVWHWMFFYHRFVLECFVFVEDLILPKLRLPLKTLWKNFTDIFCIESGFCKTFTIINPLTRVLLIKILYKFQTIKY